MNSQLQQYAKRFNAQSSRERVLISASVLIALGFVWWSYYAEPMLQKLAARQLENARIETEIATSRSTLSSIRQRMAAGVHEEKAVQLAQLVEDLNAVENRLRVATIELVDPEKMFLLMSQLVYRDSKLKLLNLERREVKPAIPEENPDAEPTEPSIYRHLLEIAFEGNYLDILSYIQSLEALDWKLLWDELDIRRDDSAKLTVKVVISTLSTRKEWVGI